MLVAYRWDWEQSTLFLSTIIRTSSASSLGHEANQPTYDAMRPAPPLTSDSTLLLRRPLLRRLPPIANPLKNALAILVHLQLRDLDLTRRNANRHALPVALLLRHPLNVDDVFQAVDAGDLALAALVRAALDGDFIVLADGNRADLQWMV